MKDLNTSDKTIPETLPPRANDFTANLESMLNLYDPEARLIIAARLGLLGYPPHSPEQICAMFDITESHLSALIFGALKYTNQHIESLEKDTATNISNPLSQDIKSTLEE